MVEYDVVPQPRRNTFGLGSIRFRSPPLTESISLSFPPLTEMFPLQRVSRFIPYVFRYERSSIASIRLPHSDIPGSSLACSFPRLFAACRVLLRLLAPRHSPYALTYFIILQSCYHSTIPQSPFVTYCIVSLLGMHVYLVFCSCCSTTHFVGSDCFSAIVFLLHADVNFAFPQ